MLLLLFNIHFPGNPLLFGFLEESPVLREQILRCVLLVQGFLAA